MADQFMTIDVQGMEGIDRFLKNAEKAFSDRVIMNGIKVGALIVQTAVRAMAPYKTGTYRRSILIEEMLAQLAVKIGSNMPGAAMQEYGGVVTPKNVKFLHFFIDGKEIFTKGPVHIPAIPHFRPGLAQSKEQVLMSVRDAVNGQLRRAA